MLLIKYFIVITTYGFTVSPIISLKVDSSGYRFNELYNSNPLFSSHSSPYYYPLPKSSLYKQLKPAFEAYNLEFAFPTEADRTLALAKGFYNPDSPIPIDVDVYYPIHSYIPKIFITIPRFELGVPYSLALLTNVPRPNGTELTAYPNYYWHDTHGLDCDDLTSVYRTQIDSCGRMWILDSGEINFVQHCSPQLIVIDLETNTQVHRYTLPKDMFTPGESRFVTPLVDVTDEGPHGKCNRAMVYMADVTGYGIVVYDVQANKSWRIQNKYTYPDPDFATLTIANESFDLLDGVLSFSITPKHLGLRRMLFFHSLCNDAHVAIPLDIVNNYEKWKLNDKTANLDEFILLGKRGVQCGPEAITSQGILLCGYLDPIAIVGWDIRTSYTSKNQYILAENPETLQFVSGLKVIVNPYGKEEVWVVSNRLQKAFSGTTDFNEINYRIQYCGVNELLLGLEC